MTIAAGLGYVSPIWAGAGLTALALVLLVLADPRGRRADASPEAVPDEGGVRPEVPVP